MLADLWRQYKHEGNADAREKLVLECLPMVKALAQRFAVYSFPCCDHDDLTSIGVIGLLDALEKYNPVMQTSFKTYAKYRIRGAILDEIRNMQWTPRSVQEKIQNLKKAHAHLEQILARKPTELELSAAMGMSVHRFRKMMVQIGPASLLMLSQKLSENDDGDFNETSIENPDSPNPLDEIISDEAKTFLTDAIESLPERESIIITLYYYEEMTMKEIGHVFSLTESRICQIHSRALLHLFGALNSKDESMESASKVQGAVAD